MKKLFVLSVCIVLSAVAFAQTPTKKDAPKAATSLTVSQPAATDAEVSSVVLDTKKAAKKECSVEEKKACGTKSGKKSCCSSEDSKKEENK